MLALLAVSLQCIGSLGPIGRDAKITGNLKIRESFQAYLELVVILRAHFLFVLGVS